MTTTGRRLTASQRDALAAVDAGRAEYGAVYPERARRARARGDYDTPAFLIDGAEAYGAAKQTLPSLEERGLIRVCDETVPTVRVPERVKEFRTLTGGTRPVTLPAHDEPADAGWRAPVTLTDAGREALR